MTINEAVKAAIDEWRKNQPGVDDDTLADYVRLLVEEAIDEYLPDTNEDYPSIDDPSGLSHGWPK